MPRRRAAVAVEQLPEHPNLDYLKKQARRRLRDQRAINPDATLAGVQLEIARAYGFTSWPALKAYVEDCSSSGQARGWAGYYRHDPTFATNAVIAILCEHDALWLETAPDQRFTLREQADGRAIIDGLDGHLTLEVDAAGRSTAVVHHKADRAIRMERIAAATGIALRAAAKAARAEQARPRTECAVNHEILDSYVGDYATPLGLAMHIDLRFGRLHAQVAGQPAFELIPESEASFFYRVLPAQISFQRVDGRPVAAVIHQNGIEQRLQRVSLEVADQMSKGVLELLAEQQRPRIPVAIDPLILERYVGRYRLDELREMHVMSNDGRLFAQITGQSRYEIHAESETGFFWTVVAAQISFVRASAGDVLHAVLHQNGRDMPLARLPAREADS